MFVIAVLFLIFTVARLIAFFYDQGFGETIWTYIMYISSIAWLLGAIMALEFLGLLPRLEW